MLLSLQLWHCSGIALTVPVIPVYTSTVQMVPEIPQSSTLGIKGQVAALGLPQAPRGLSPVQLYLVTGVVLPQSMHRGLPCTAMGVCAQPWARDWLWVL